MTKKVIIGIIIAVVVLGLGYLALYAPSITITDNPAQATQKMTINTNNTGSPAKLKIEDLTVGTGKEAKSGDTVTVNYKGTLTNGKQFDSSYDRKQPFSTKIGVGQVIKGWDQGIPGMKVGGKRRL